MNPVIVIIQFDKKFRSIIAIRMFRFCFGTDLALRSICPEWPSFLFAPQGSFLNARGSLSVNVKHRWLWLSHHVHRSDDMISFTMYPVHCPLHYTSISIVILYRRRSIFTILPPRQSLHLASIWPFQILIVTQWVTTKQLFLF